MQVDRGVIEEKGERGSVRREGEGAIFNHSRWTPPALCTLEPQLNFLACCQVALLVKPGKCLDVNSCAVETLARVLCLLTAAQGQVRVNLIRVLQCADKLDNCFRTLVLH